MQKQLLRSFLVVAAFWWAVFFLAFSLSEPALNLSVVRRIHQAFPFLAMTLPRQASALNALSLQIEALKFWSLPVLGITLLLALIGAGLAAAVAAWFQHQRKRHEQRGQKSWRGVRVTLGELPPLASLPRIQADLLIDAPAEAKAATAEAEGPALQQALARLPAAHQQLIQEIIEVLAAHPDAYVGPGHQGTLLEHSVHVLEEVLLQEEAAKESLLPVAAIAHDLGKIQTFQKDQDGEWQRTGWHDKASARILATLPAWWNLPDDDRLVLDLAIRYDHSSRDMPFPTRDILRRRALELQNLLSTSDRVATAAEKQAVLADLPLPDLAFEAFMDALPTLPLHVAGHAPAKSVKAAGWKQGPYLFLLENQCRERSMAVMATEVAAALGGAFRAQHKLAPFTEHLFEGLGSRQLLVTEWEGQSVPRDNALWNLQSGTKDFKGVLIIRITDEMRLRLPETDTTYVLTVKGPLRSPSLPGEMGVDSPLDLKGLLRPSRKKREGGAEPAEPNKPSGGYVIEKEEVKTQEAKETPPAEALEAPAPDPVPDPVPDAGQATETEAPESSPVESELAVPVDSAPAQEPPASAPETSPVPEVAPPPPEAKPRKKVWRRPPKAPV